VTTPSTPAGRVCVVGGGDSAIENCLILARVCPEVALIHRSDRFRARQAWLDEALATEQYSRCYAQHRGDQHRRRRRA
jgi:thioredoxin reductase